MSKSNFSEEFIHDTVRQIGVAGTKLSGGERQRLAIARAILKDAPIIVLDEASAMADADNEAAIQEAIRALTASKTLIVVAHRLHTVMYAQQIVVLSSGHLIEKGRHEQLLAARGVYSALWRSYGEVDRPVIPGEGSARQSGQS